jgi:hypothetical protein
MPGNYTNRLLNAQVDQGSVLCNTNSAILGWTHLCSN